MASSTITRLLATVLFASFLSDMHRVVQAQVSCDVNCAAGCSKTGPNRCDGPCYGGFYLTANNTCTSLVNLARLQPAYQISTFKATYPASLIVDGNKDTNWVAGSCSSTTNSKRNPWWAVDLGQPFSVVGVNLTSRADWTGITGVDYFIVGLTNTQPQVGIDIPLYNYTLCGQYPSVVPLGATVYQPCPLDLLQFRYVIIQSNLSMEYLEMCELEVYGFACDERCLDGCGRYGPSTCNRNCYPGYGLNTATKTCQACDANCVGGCNAKGGGKCDGLCKVGYGVTFSGICSMCDLNCAGGCNTTGGGKCDGPCNSGYGINSNKTCSLCDQNCAVGCNTTGGGRCDGPCKFGFGLSNNLCSPCDQKCSGGCNATGGGKCDGSCSFGYGIVISNNTCSPCDPNCAENCSVAGGGKCDGICRSGFGINSNGTCSLLTTVTSSANLQNKINSLTVAVIALAVIAGLLLDVSGVATAVLVNKCQSREPATATYTAVDKRIEDRNYQELQVKNQPELLIASALYAECQSFGQ